MRRRLVEATERLASHYQRSGQIDPEAVAEIERLDRVARAYEHARPAARPWPWRVPLIALITAALVSLLLFVRVPCTEVTLDLSLSSLAFQLSGPDREASDRVIALTTEDIAATRVTVRGINTVAAEPGRTATTTGRDTLSFLSDSGFVIGPIELPSGTWVRISPPRFDGKLLLRFKHDSRPTAIALHLSPDVTVVPRNILTARLGERREPTTVTLASDPNQPLELELIPQLQDGGTIPEALARISETFGSELPITGINLEWGDPWATRRGVFSSVLNGSVYREALAGKGYDLRRGEYLQMSDDVERSHQRRPAWTRPIEMWLFPRFGSCRVLGRPDDALGLSGAMTAISIAPERLALQAQADTRSLAVGSRGQTRDLMPRLLEWLQANAEMSLFWSVFFYLFLVVLLPLLRFWGIER